MSGDLLSQGVGLTAPPPAIWGPAHRLADVEEVTPSRQLKLTVDPSARAVLNHMDETVVPNYDAFFRTLADSCIGTEICPGLVLETSRGCWWGANYWAKRAVLEMRDLGETMVVRDTRPVAVAAELVLEGLGCRIYRLCATARTLSSLVTALGTESTQTAIAEEVQALCDLRILLALDGKFLALAMTAKREAFPPPEQAPWGFVDLVGVFRGMGEKSLAAQVSPTAD